MTNGEKIIKTFPDEDGVIVQGVTCVYYGTMRFDTTWWNAEYKEQEPIDCANAEHDADGCLGYSNNIGGYSYCQTCLECPKASINNRDKEQESREDASIEFYDLEGYVGSSEK